MILEKARELGIALSESQEFQAMLSAREAFDANEAVTKMLEEYQNKQQQIMDMLSGDNLDRAAVTALSSDVEALQTQLTENPLFAAVMQAQNEFQNLMNQVNREIGRCIGMAEEEETIEASCSGSCAGCRST